MPIPYHALTPPQRSRYDHLSGTFHDLVEQCRHPASISAFKEHRAQLAATFLEMARLTEDKAREQGILKLMAKHKSQLS
jgi:hypothetical protein